jgi:long-chain acyl-CoA synthetase
MNRTPLQYFLKWQKETPDHVFLRQPISDQWHAYTYRQAGEEVAKIASALKGLNLPPQSNIAILSKNCAHWLMTDLAIMLAGHVSVPIYPTLSAAGIKQIIDHSNPLVIFVGKLDDYKSQRLGISESIQKISFPFYGIEEGLKWDDLVQKNMAMTTDSIPGEEQLATIMYSSGTTGTPKGVMLTHGAFGLVGEQVMKTLQIEKPEKFISYLPLSHIAERGLMEMTAIASGSTVSFVESLDKFAQNLQHEMPTVFGGVPRIYLKFQEGVLKKMPQKKLDRLLKIPIVKNIIRNTIRKKLGLAKARIVVSGAAPTPGSLIEWFGKLGIVVREAYGMTENTAFSHVNYPKIKIGSVGQPWPGVETKIGEEGEILIRNKALMKGYYKDEETTNQVFTMDGFLKTGDQGAIDKDGFLFITGRIKDQFKTDKAKFIAPAPIEMSLLANRDIEQVCVVGMGIPQPIALVTLSVLAKEKNTEQVNEGLRQIMKSVNSTLESYEQLRVIVVLKNDWTIENGLLTPSMKVKRNELEKKYMSTYPVWYALGKDVVYE